MPKIAEHIHVEAGKLTIDGEDFPWYISEEGAKVSAITRGDIGRVTVTIIADRVTVDHSLTPKGGWQDGGVVKGGGGLATLHPGERIEPAGGGVQPPPQA